MRGLGADDPYWASLKQGNLELQQCECCNKWNWPAVWRCGECGSWDHKWKGVAIAGEIFSWTRSWHDFGAPRELDLPFVSVVVTLDGADHTRIVGVLSKPDETVAIGQRVTGQVINVTFNSTVIPVIQWQLAN